LRLLGDSAVFAKFQRQCIWNITG